MYAATPRVLITGWLEGVSLSTLLDGRTDLLPAGWRELGGGAADLAARLLGHAIYAPAACTGWMHADLHPGNFLLLPGGRLGMLDFGAAAATPGGIPAPFGQLAAAVLAGDGPAAMRLARQVGALAPGAAVDPQLIVELLHPLVATAAADSFTYSRPWLRRLMAHLAEPRFAPALRNLTPPLEYALVWRATLSAAGLFAQLGATVPHPRVPPGLFPRIPQRNPPRPSPSRHATPAEPRPPPSSRRGRRGRGLVGRSRSLPVGRHTRAVGASPATTSSARQVPIGQRSLGIASVIARPEPNVRLSLAVAVVMGSIVTAATLRLRHQMPARGAGCGGRPTAGRAGPRRW